MIWKKVKSRESVGLMLLSGFVVAGLLVAGCGTQTEPKTGQAEQSASPSSETPGTGTAAMEPREMAPSQEPAEGPKEVEAMKPVAPAEPASEATQEKPEEKTQAEEKDLVQTAVAAGKFTTLAKALEAANLVETLRGEGPFTVFAPSDEAFAALPPGTVDNLLKNPEQLKRVLLYHVVSGRVTAEEAMNLDKAKTVEGNELTIKVENGRVLVNGAQVTKPDWICKNGVIHVIDKVLLPPEK